MPNLHADLRRLVVLTGLALLLPARLPAAEPAGPDDLATGSTSAGSPASAAPRAELALALGSWDPLREAAPAGAAASLVGLEQVGADGSPSDGGVRLVQGGPNGGGPAGRALEAAMRAEAGVTILGRVPPGGWLLRVEPEALPRLESWPGLRWAGPWSPALKPAPPLMRILEGAPPPAAALQGEALRLRAVFHRDEDAAAWTRAVAGIEGVATRDLQAGSIGLLVRADRLAAAVRSVAALSGVAHLELDEIPQPHADHTAWALQSGIADLDLDEFDLTASLWARGVNGAGTQLVLIDSGLENDLAAFQYAQEIDESAWQVVPLPGPLPLEEGEPRFDAARSRLRKVTGYYLLEGAEAYEGAHLHGTRVAATAVADLPQSPPDPGGRSGALAALPRVRDLGVGQNLPSCERPDGAWTPGEVLREGDGLLVDDPAVAEPGIDNPHGSLVQHHDEADGLAPGAQLMVFDIGNLDGALTGELPRYEAMIWADQLGGTTQVTAFGGAPCTDCYHSRPAEADRGLWSRRMLVAASSAGNEGRDGAGTIGSGYSHAKSVIAAGATERANSPSAFGARPGQNIANFSAKGPATGGVIAPELVTPGQVIVREPLALTPEDGSGSGDHDRGTTGLIYGTSASAGALAGASLLVQQYFLDGYYPNGRATADDALRPTNALVRAILINSAREQLGARTNRIGTGQGHRPNHGQGWGKPVLDDTLYFEGDPRMGVDPLGDLERAGLLLLSDTPNGLVDLSALTPEPGGRTRTELLPWLRPAVAERTEHEWTVPVENLSPGHRAFDLRVTLAWSDPDGEPWVSSPLVNDLDLEVIDPDGVIYRPDPFSAWSLGYTNPAAVQEPQLFDPVTGYSDHPDRDERHTVENVFVRSENVVPGDWTVRVIGYSVPGNGRASHPATPNFVAGDAPLDRDTSVPCDGLPDEDSYDLIDSRFQGFALVVSGGVGQEPVGCSEFSFAGAPSVTAAGCDLELSWPPAVGAWPPVTYQVYRADSLPVPLDPTHLVASLSGATSWTDEDTGGRPWAYRVVATDSCPDPGPRSAPNEGGDVGPVSPIDDTPPEFAGVVDTRDLGYCEVEVSWDESTASDDCSGIAGYNVYRDNGVGRRGRTLVAEGVPASPYVDTTPGNGTWVYVVRAVDGAGNEEQNDVFQQESENSCTNDFPEDAGMDDENGVDPPNGDGGSGSGFAPGAVGGGDLESRLEARIERSRLGLLDAGDMRIAWNPSPSEGGLYPISYSVLRGDLSSLASGGYSHSLAEPAACGIVAHETTLADQVDGRSYYYIVVPVSGDNATFGYDHLGVERPETEVCE